MGRHARTKPRREQPPEPEPDYEPYDYSYEAPPERTVTPLLAETRPQAVLRTRKKRPPLTLFKKVMIGIAALIAVFVVLGAIGNLLPQKANKGAPASPNPARAVAVADMLRNNSPSWYVARHIVAVVRPEDGGKSVTLVNSGHGTASGVITFPELGITASAVSVWNVWGHTLSPPTVRALRVVLPEGTAEYLILR